MPESHVHPSPVTHLIQDGTKKPLSSRRVFLEGSEARGLSGGPCLRARTQRPSEPLCWQLRWSDLGPEAPECRGRAATDLTMIGSAVPGQPGASCHAVLLGMSLLSSYEGLRQEIQRLAQENEELRRLVQLIQENQELKLVLRNRGTSLSFCSSGFLTEVTSGPRAPRRRTFKFKDADRGEKLQPTDLIQLLPRQRQKPCQASDAAGGGGIWSKARVGWRGETFQEAHAAGRR